MNTAAVFKVGIINHRPSPRYPSHSSTAHAEKHPPPLFFFSSFVYKKTFMATDADTKVENENASARAVDYTAYPPPPAPREKPTAEADELTPAQAEMHKRVLEHFRSESYRLPGVKEDEDGELRDEEKFWLVRFFFFCFLLVDDWCLIFMFFVRSLMIACCGKEVYLSLKLAL